MAPEQVARHQRRRLMAAMLEAVSRHGYTGVTLRELVALAGVSKSTFYEHFESKQDCFFTTYGEIAARGHERVEAAYMEAGGFRQKLTAALGAYMEAVAEAPEAAALGAVESLALGAAGFAQRERDAREYERLARRGFEGPGSPGPLSELAARVIVGGINGLTYRRLRAGRAEELPGLVEPLVEWGLALQHPVGEAARRAAAAAARPPAPSGGAAGEEERPSWAEPPDSPRSRRELSQRERIARGAARVAVERGYEALSIPAISGAAGVSNQTFYEHFPSKREAFLAALEELAARALAPAGAAFAAAQVPPEAVGAGLRALLERIAAEESFARLACFELPAAGPAALDRADAALDGVAALLEPGAAARGAAGRAIAEASASGSWAVVQREIAAGRGARVAELAPGLAELVLAPHGR